MGPEIRSTLRLACFPLEKRDGRKNQASARTADEQAAGKTNKGLTDQLCTPVYRKGVSFLSRLSILGRRKGTDHDSDSESGGEVRTDGFNARAFSQSISGPMPGGGYVAHHKEPPRYIRTKVRHKKAREFHQMFLAQELKGYRPTPPVQTVTSKTESSQDSGGAAGEENAAAPVSMPLPAQASTVGSGKGAVWTTEFSQDGKYLAAGGRDQIVRVWAVISTPEERQSYEEEQQQQQQQQNQGSSCGRERLSAPVFHDQPFREFAGHTGEVLDLSWSKNNFLLSSSMDRTVRLWHISRAECLCTFKHKDFVTKLAFHPRDDRFFLAGSLDTMLRLWSIPDKAVAYTAQLPDLVTAVAFAPD